MSRHDHTGHTSGRQNEATGKRRLFVKVLTADGVDKALGAPAAAKILIWVNARRNFLLPHPLLKLLVLLALHEGLPKARRSRAHDCNAVRRSADHERRDVAREQCNKHSTKRRGHFSRHSVGDRQISRREDPRKISGGGALAKSLPLEIASSIHVRAQPTAPRTQG